MMKQSPPQPVAVSSSLEAMLGRRLLWVMLPALALLLVLVHVSIHSVMREFVLSRLQHDAESLIGALQQDEQGYWQLENGSSPLVYQRALSGHYYQITPLSDEGSPLRSRSLWDISIGTPPMAMGDHQSEEMKGPASQYWLVWRQSFRKQQQNFSLWIAEDIAPQQARLYQLESGLLLLTVLIILVVVLWQRRILKRGFASLHPLQQALEQQQAGVKLPLPAEIPVEVRPLVRAIETLLLNAEQRIQRSRTAMGNLAHELKRPLQQLNQTIEQTTDPETRRVLNEIYQRLYQQIERELRRARIAGTPTPGHRFVPSEEIPTLIKLFNSIYSHPVTINTELPEGSIPFDRDDMLELLGNLIDNAWRHAHAQVKLSISPTSGNSWQFVIEDDGAGVPDADQQKLTQRGQRLDEESGGHGIGLSLCKDIVDSYHGQINFSHSSIGGLQVTIQLPG